MSNGVKVTGIIVGVLAAIFSYNFINTYVYPFQKQNPNFSDVEKAFAKLQFPTEWQEISSSENRGLHGRGCKPIDNSGCFHKSRTFKMPPEFTTDYLQKTLINAGCTGVNQQILPDGNSSTDPKTAVSMSCQAAPGIIYSASSSQRNGEISVTATSAY